MFIHPEVNNIIKKRRDYINARESFLSEIRKNPLFPKITPEGLECWLVLAVVDIDLCNEIRQMHVEATHDTTVPPE